MTPTYSHSRISTFEQCPFKFKLRYIDKIIPEIAKSIEIHLGATIHDTLEWLYIQVKEGKVPEVDDVITHYAEEWQEDLPEDIVIVKSGLTAKDYFNKGVSFLIDYYMRYKPFDENTLEVEKKIIIQLDDGGEYKVQGFIDRLVHNLETGEYEIHDYKTANSLPRQQKIDEDRQLALYAIAIKDLFGHDKEICLVWHYLAHNKRICSRRSDEQLAKLKHETLKLIKKIESTTDFPPQKSTLCHWCEYKVQCPLFNNKLPSRQESLDKFPTVRKYIKE